MRETKIRFGLRSWEMIQRCAREGGVSASQYVREAALMRCVYDLTRAGHAPDPEMQEKLLAEIRRQLDPAHQEDDQQDQDH